MHRAGLYSAPATTPNMQLVGHQQENILSLVSQDMADLEGRCPLCGQTGAIHHIPLDA